MNRRRFLSMLGILPAALALPVLPRRQKVWIMVHSPMNDFRTDLQYATILSGGIVSGPRGAQQLIMAHGGESIIPVLRKH